MYYTNGVNLKSTVRQPLDTVIYSDPSDGKQLTLRTGCASLWVFSPPPGAVYGVSP